MVISIDGSSPRRRSREKRIHRLNNINIDLVMKARRRMRRRTGLLLNESFKVVLTRTDAGFPRSPFGMYQPCSLVIPSRTRSASADLTSCKQPCSSAETSVRFLTYRRLWRVRPRRWSRREHRYWPRMRCNRALGERPGRCMGRAKRQNGEQSPDNEKTNFKLHRSVCHNCSTSLTANTISPQIRMSCRQTNEHYHRKTLQSTKITFRQGPSIILTIFET